MLARLLRMRSFLLGASLLLIAVLWPPSMAQQGNEPRSEFETIPFAVDGVRRDMALQVYKPTGKGPFPVVLYLHGRPVNTTGREGLKYPIETGHADFWLRRGVAVIAPVRPGYGSTGGPDLEDTGARWRGGECSGEPDFARAAENARQSAVAAYDWAVKQPWVRKDRIVVEGQSFGGLAAVATGALNLPGVRGVVNFSGGTAGNPVGAPGRSCRPELLAAAYAVFGKQARVPSLWLYAENDRYWGPQVPKNWHAAYWSGGSDSELVMTAAVEGDDGHQLLMAGPELWLEHLDGFIRKVGLVAR